MKKSNVTNKKFKEEIKMNEKKKNQFKYKHYLSRNYALCVEMKRNYYTRLNQRDRKILDYYFYKC